jgi:CHAT domain-containing protein
LIRKDRSAWSNLAVTGTELEEMIGKLRRQLDPTSGETTFDLDLAHQLYRKLFPFNADLLNGVKQIIVVPHGPLESIPFSVLVLHPPPPDGGYRGADFLVERFATVTLPPVSSLRALRRFAGQSSADRPFAGIGDPVFAGSSDADRRIEVTRLFRSQGGVNTEALRRLPALPETATELRALARFLGAGEESLLLGGAATEAAVKTAPLAQARVIAFATHAGVAGELAGFAEPALVLTPPSSPTPTDDGLLTASEIAQLQLDADFVVLSACNTAAPDGSPGAAGLSGLAKSFIYAGSRSLLVSHWAVLSDAAEKLTTGTMAKLAADPTLGRAEALRRTEVELLQDTRYSHPAACTPFVIVGEWGNPGQLASQLKQF